jgi:Glyoxalase/Bleomycin resistance protein/Dioxygenase superfamily
MAETNQFVLEFHHFGLAVRKSDKAIAFLANLNYSIGNSIYDELQNVNLIMCCHQIMPDVELIYPSESPGPLDGWLKEQSEIIYHLCYTCLDLEFTLTQLRAKHRVMTISAPKPAILFGDRKVSFYKVQGFGIIEILENSVEL